VTLLVFPDDEKGGETRDVGGPARRKEEGSSLDHRAEGTASTFDLRKRTEIPPSPSHSLRKRGKGQIICQACVQQKRFHHKEGCHHRGKKKREVGRRVAGPPGGKEEKGVIERTLPVLPSGYLLTPPPAPIEGKGTPMVTGAAW